MAMSIFHRAVRNASGPAAASAGAGTVPGGAPSLVKFAVTQLTSKSDKKANGQLVESVISKASEAGALMVFLPECAMFLGESSAASIRAAEKGAEGRMMKKLAGMARRFKVWISVAGVQQVTEDPTKLYNTHFILDSSGSVVAEYRKSHLFDFSSSSISLSESDYTKAGNDMVVVDTPVGRLGVTTCYDIRFPTMYKRLREAGADIFAVPSAFTVPTGMEHWEPLLKARAIENQCYVVAAAQVGKHNAKRETYGHACVIDPWGSVITDCGRRSPAVGMAEFDSQYLRTTRYNMPVDMHAREDMYFSAVKVCQTGFSNPRKSLPGETNDEYWNDSDSGDSPVDKVSRPAQKRRRRSNDVTHLHNNVSSQMPIPSASSEALRGQLFIPSSILAVTRKEANGGGHSSCASNCSESTRITHCSSAIGERILPRGMNNGVTRNESYPTAISGAAEAATDENSSFNNESHHRLEAGGSNITLTQNPASNRARVSEGDHSLQSARIDEDVNRTPDREDMEDDATTPEVAEDHNNQDHNLSETVQSSPHQQEQQREEHRVHHTPVVATTPNNKRARQEDQSTRRRSARRRP